MMKLEAIHAFTDKATGVFHPIGDVFVVDDARGKELLAHPLELVRKLGTTAENKPKKPRA